MWLSRNEGEKWYDLFWITTNEKLSILIGDSEKKLIFYKKTFKKTFKIIKF